MTFKYTFKTMMAMTLKSMYDSWIGKIPWRRKWQPSPVFLPGESHGQTSLVTEQSDVTEHIHKITFIYPAISTYMHAQSCQTLCDSMDCSPPGSSVPGIFQAKILDWVAIPFSRGSSQPRGQTQVSCAAGWFFLMFEPPGKPLSFNMTSILCMEYFFPSHLTTVHS